MKSPIRWLNAFERAAAKILIQAYCSGGEPPHWRSAITRLRALEAKSAKLGMESTGRKIRDAIRQCEVCVRHPESEIARLRANGFANH